MIVIVIIRILSLKDLDSDTKCIEDIVIEG